MLPSGRMQWHSENEFVNKLLKVTDLKYSIVSDGHSPRLSRG